MRYCTLTTLDNHSDTLHNTPMNTEPNTELRTLAREYERANTAYHEALSDPGCSDALLDLLDAECERILSAMREAQARA